MGTEVGQPVLDEVVERRQRLPAGRREPARPVAADEGDLAVALPAVQVVADLLVDLVLLRPPGLRDAQGRSTPRRRLAVVVVEVPPTTDGPVTVHEHAVRAARPPVEVLHQQPGAVATGGPALEVLARGREAAGVEDGQVEVVGQPPHQPQRGVRRGVDDLDRGTPRVVADGLGVPAVGPDVGRLVAELARAVAHRGQHQVGLGPVEPAPGEHAPGLDQQHRPAVVTGEVRSELVPEDPAQRGHVRACRAPRAAPARPRRPAS